MGEQGIRYRESEIIQVLDYVEQMRKSGRILSIEDQYGLHSVFFFSVCHDMDKFYKKKMWTYLDHEPEGRVLYIEKAVSRKWTRELRREVYRIILKKFPKLRLCKFHRYGKMSDRECTIRREKNGTANKSTCLK